mmetsp:Transcript_24316/g.79206  ORF Transcript_24316/g.79206 Transcript_24316/m.79206 type:complete len:270 (+) Transcript_24316:73-882(+)
MAGSAPPRIAPANVAQPASVNGLSLRSRNVNVGKTEAYGGATSAASPSSPIWHLSRRRSKKAGRWRSCGARAASPASLMGLELRMSSPSFGSAPRPRAAAKEAAPCSSMPVKLRLRKSTAGKAAAGSAARNRCTPTPLSYTIPSDERWVPATSRVSCGISPTSASAPSASHSETVKPSMCSPVAERAWVQLGLPGQSTPSMYSSALASSALACSCRRRSRPSAASTGARMLREAALRATAGLGSRGRQRRSKMISSSSSLRPGKPGSQV